jgi:para-nitrobenzyl esterase
VVLPQYPLEAIQQGKAGRVPTLIGSNRDESKLYIAMDPRVKRPNENALIEYFGSNGPVVYAAYERNKSEDAWAQTLTDYLYRLASVYQAECQAEHNVPVWMYRFDWAGPLGACHGLELPFVFHGSLGSPDSGAFSMLMAPITAENKPLADLMHAAWIAFIRTGNPHIAGLSDWPQYTTSERVTMIFDTISHVEQVPPIPIETEFPIQQAFVLQQI